MKSLVVFSYKQPANGSKVRFGILEHTRDTQKDKLLPSTIWGKYRRWDKEFKRSQNLLTVRGIGGFRKFYAERVNWSVEIPFIGSLVGLFI